MSVNKYFKEEKLCRTINNALKLQAIVIGYTNFMSNIFPYDSLIKNTFKNLNTYAHQNFLFIILFFLQRLPSELRNSNKYAISLKEVLKGNNFKSNLTKREAYMAMKQKNDILSKMLKTASHGKPKRSIDDIIALILKNLKMLELAKVRRFIHNSSKIRPKLPALSGASIRNFGVGDNASIEGHRDQQVPPPSDINDNKTSHGAIMGLPPGMKLPKSPFLPERDDGLSK